VAVAVARRAGLSEDRLDEVRLAVGEMCARAVRRSLRWGEVRPVSVDMDDMCSQLTVVVTDQAGGTEGEEEAVGLALVRGLADWVAVEVGPGGTGGVVRMRWIGV
jgi:anti-sigma regulatory factor (Ser/Thr protein kinase)